MHIHEENPIKNPPDEGSLWESAMEPSDNSPVMNMCKDDKVFFDLLYENLWLVLPYLLHLYCIPWKHDGGLVDAAGLGVFVFVFVLTLGTMDTTVGKFWWEGRAILHCAEKSILSVPMTIPTPNPVLALRFKTKDRKQMGGWLCLLISPLGYTLPTHTKHLPPVKEKKIWC